MCHILPPGLLIIVVTLFIITMCYFTLDCLAYVFHEVWHKLSQSPLLPQESISMRFWRSERIWQVQPNKQYSYSFVLIFDGLGGGNFHHTAYTNQILSDLHKYIGLRVKGLIWDWATDKATIMQMLMRTERKRVWPWFMIDRWLTGDVNRALQLTAV